MFTPQRTEGFPGPALRLSGTNVVITGATGGIGGATARLLGAHGASLILSGRDADSLYRLREELGRLGIEAVCAAGDVADAETWTRILDTADRAFGGADILLHCAGALVPGVVAAAAEADIRAQIDTNLLGTVLGTRALVPHFMRRKRGHIIIVGSLGAYAPMPCAAVYCATKFALRGFARSLTLELRETGINVSLVQPDAVATRMLAREAAEPGAWMAFTGRPLSAESAAAAILRTILSPKREVLLPFVRGGMSRIADLFPFTVGLLRPFLIRSGTARRLRVLREVASSSTLSADGPA